MGGSMVTLDLLCTFTALLTIDLRQFWIVLFRLPPSLVFPLTFVVTKDLRTGSLRFICCPS